MTPNRGRGIALCRLPGGRVPFFDSSGVSIHYISEGVGPPATLVHGLSSSIEQNWRRPGVISALVAAGHRVVALDCRGHGQSDKPHDAASYGDGKMALDVIALMDHLAIEKSDLVGYSMGGAIAASLLVRHPERLERVVLAGVGDWVLRTPRQGQAAASRGRPFGRRLAGRIARRTGNDQEALDAMQRAPRDRVDRATLGQVTSPVLILNGSRDLAAGQATRLVTAIPGARSARVPGGHLTAVGRPEFRSAIVHFLAR